MKPEPLKSKWSELNRGFENADIKSAVEWFIKNLREDVNKTGAIILIKRAFEDVIKK